MFTSMLSQTDRRYRAYFFYFYICIYLFSIYLTLHNFEQAKLEYFPHPVFPGKLVKYV